MALQQMYPGMVNSPQTELASAIDDQQTTIPLLDASVLPAAPNLATIGTGEDAETVLYEGIDGNNLTGVTRGFQGAAKAWVQGTKVARNFTAYDYDALRQNVADHVAATTGVHGATSAATPNTLVQRDSAGRFKAAAPSASDDVARKAEVDAVDSAAMKKTADSELNMNGRSVRNIAKLNIGGFETCIIENNAITPTKSYVTVDTSGGAGELHTINGGSVGDILILRCNSASRPVTIKHSVGNIVINDGLDVLLNDGHQIYILAYSGTVWRVLGNVGVKRTGDTIIGELSIRAPGQNLESAVNLIDNTGNRKGRLFYHLDSDRVVFRKYAPSGEIAADVVFNESEFMYRIGSTYYTVYHAANAGPFYKGSGSPEGVVTAPVGSIYQRTDGSAGSTLYVKRSGTGNTGWFAVA